jgi:uncharacterized protein (UPF0333 family)
MNRTTTNTISKVAAIVAASALVAMSVVIAPVAHADTSMTTTTMTSAQMQAQIASLQAQLAASSMSTMTMSFTRNLTIGSSGSDVTALQTWLIGKGESLLVQLDTSVPRLRLL